MVALAVLATAPMRLKGQTPNSTTAIKPKTTATHPLPGSNPPTQTSPAAASQIPAAGAEPFPEGNPQSATQPQIIVNPPPAPQREWDWRDRVAWGSGIVLAILGYMGIMMGLRTLKSIDRHLVSSGATSQAALESANAALALAEAIANSERPWIVVTVEPFLTMENSFKVMASNRGRSPARIVVSLDQTKVAVDETQLPTTPEFDKRDPADEREPIVLLPGEATGIWAFNREDLPAICKSSEVLKKVERWTETLFLYGRITYLDLNAPVDKQMHETFWCCRYIHGEKSSALVMAGPPPYNKHS